jgi:hypothetical protein
VDEAAAAAAHAAVAAVVVAVSAPAVTAAAAAAAAACKLTLVATATRPQRLAPSAGRTAWLCTRHTSPRVRARGRHCRRPPLPAACASSPVPPRAGLQQETQETQEGGRQVPERVAACARPARTLSGAHILHVRRAWAVMCSARQAALRTTRELPHVASCLLRSMSSTRASQKQQRTSANAVVAAAAGTANADGRVDAESVLTAGGTVDVVPHHADVMEMDAPVSEMPVALSMMADAPPAARCPQTAPGPRSGAPA